MKPSWIAGVLVLSSVAGLAQQWPAPGHTPAEREPRDFPNVLIVVLDDLGTDKLGMYGEGIASEVAPTPNLDELAARGVRFTNAWASPVCSPTRAMILTGRHAFRTGMYNFIQGGETEASLSSNEVLLPAYLKDSNSWTGTNPQYACGAFGKYHIATGSDVCHAIDGGFDRFQGTMGNVGDHYAWSRITLGPPPCAGATPEPMTEWIATVASRDARDWIDGQTRPWLAYVGLHPPHDPNQVPEPFSPPSALDHELMDPPPAGFGLAPRENLGGLPLSAGRSSAPA